MNRWRFSLPTSFDARKTLPCGRGSERVFSERVFMFHGAARNIMTFAFFRNHSYALQAEAVGGLSGGRASTRLRCCGIRGCGGGGRL